MQIVQRTIRRNIEDHLFKGKVVILYGPRQVGKTTLIKDVLQYRQIKHSDVLERLLQALALQVGHEVSFNELAATVGIDKKTVASYIKILEKAFIIFRLSPFSRNLRNELKKLRKIVSA